MDASEADRRATWPVAWRRVWRLRGDEIQREEAPIVLEEPLALHINDTQVAVLMRLPGQEKELAVGFCLSEGLVRRWEDILMVHHCGQGLPEPGEQAVDAASPFSRNRVDMRVVPEGLNPDARLEVVRLVRAGCGAVDGAQIELPLEPVQDDLHLPSVILQGLGRAMRPAQVLHEAVGGVHAAGLFDAQGRLLAAAEDVGRHNAVDKVIGACVLRGVSLAARVLLCSGRLSYEMVAKAVRMRVPMLVSLSAPTALAVSLAERYGITLVGYLRAERMTVYTHGERLDLE